MLAKLDIEFTCEEKINYNIGSSLHGLLMQMIDSEYAEYLHNNALKPFSQCINKIQQPNTYLWQISTINKNAFERLITPILNFNKNTLTLTKNNIELNVQKKTIHSTITYEELANKCFEENNKNKIKLKFITPTTIKVNGDYQLFPDLKTFYPSLLNKWNTFCSEISLDDEETKQHLINYSKIVDYKLRSTRFYMEKVKINSFMGVVDIRFFGPQTLTNISNLLFKYSEYTGVGAKTALGMGGVRIE